MSFHFDNSAVAHSDNNQHNDSQTYCDALFIFCLCLITRYHLTTITLKCVWITSSEERKEENGSYIAYLSCKEGLLQPQGRRSKHSLTHRGYSS